jgi:hypothetical protein
MKNTIYSRYLNKGDIPLNFFIGTAKLSVSLGAHGRADTSNMPRIYLG